MQFALARLRMTLDISTIYRTCCCLKIRKVSMRPKHIRFCVNCILFHVLCSFGGLCTICFKIIVFLSPNSILVTFFIGTFLFSLFYLKNQVLYLENLYSFQRKKWFKIEIYVVQAFRLIIYRLCIIIFKRKILDWGRI